MNDDTINEQENAIDNDTLVDELHTLEQQYTYLRADFDNYKKRTNRILGEAQHNERVSIFSSMLLILDDMERLNSSISDDNISQNEIGFQMIYENIRKMLASYGCEPIEVHVGDVFDVKLHEAISTSSAKNEADIDTIASIVQTGWKLNDTVIRHTKVIVNA